MKDLTLFLAPFSRLVDFGDPFSVLSMVAALFCAVVFLRHSMTGSLQARASVIIHKVFATESIESRSFRLDLKLFVFNSVIFAAAAAWLNFSEPMWRASTYDAVAAILGGHEAVENGATWSKILITLVGFLAAEAGFWLAHWLCHEIPLFWRFHQLHHSAPVMTPFTALRQHPIEIILFIVVVGAFVGTGEALLVATLGTRGAAIDCFGVNVFLFLYFLTLQHFRHSPLWMPLQGWTGCLLQSPAHHQLHHSRAEASQHSNLGFALATFDWLFGTLELPTGKQVTAFGTTPEAGQIDGLWEACFAPITRKDLVELILCKGKSALSSILTRLVRDRTNGMR
ncbi:sterol desaturase family protein [Methylocystis sp.]|uniref:sterol desaturase family protein n=1 Tax=Methylocystis sp. TaxID=1911079 RepID=UPI0025E49F1C|nr:sterol desaturase family protein [Methylocystis sp.]